MVKTSIFDAIEKSGMKKGAIAEKMGITYASLNNKLNGKNSFTVNEAFKLLATLGIPESDFTDFFCSND